MMSKAGEDSKMKKDKVLAFPFLSIQTTLHGRLRSAIMETQKKAQQKEDFIGFDQEVQDFCRFQTSNHQTDLISKRI